MPAGGAGLLVSVAFTAGGGAGGVPLGGGGGGGYAALSLERTVAAVEVDVLRMP